MFYRPYDSRMNCFRQRFSDWSETVLGTSEEGRPIVAFHNAPLEETEILAWSLMHGNETTGAEALLSLDTRADSKWCIVPIMNPDGAERFTRVNANGVDINRDARKLQSSEAQALKEVFTLCNPSLALNLHDQRTCFRPENGNRPATFSFLAPKSSIEGGCRNEMEATKWCAWMAEHVSQKCPEYALARFDNSFYPTAFGDMFQESVPTITLETGIALGDWDRAGVADALCGILNRLDERMASHGKGSEGLSNFLDLPMNVDDAVDLLWLGDDAPRYYQLHLSLSNDTLTRSLHEVNNIEMGVAWLTIEKSSQFDALDDIDWEEYLNR